MSEELNPCPFCGGEAHASLAAYASGATAHALCDGCGAVVLGYGRGERGLRDATERWNRRAERTCNVESSHVEWERGDYSYLEVELSCGHAFTWDDGTPPGYCPYCGCKVITDAD